MSPDLLPCSDNARQLSTTSGNPPMAKSFYFYHPRTGMTLGGGYLPTDLLGAKRVGIEFKPVPTEPGALETGFSSTIVTNSLQMKQALSFDMSVEANGFGMSAAGSFDYNSNSRYASNSITMVLKIYTNFANMKMDDAHLTKDAQSLIDSKQMDEFVQTYGSRYVVMEARGAMVAVILRVSDVSDDTNSTVKTSLSASGGWGPISGKARAAFEKEVENASQQGRLDIEVYSFGGQGLGDLSNLVKSQAAKADAFSNIEVALSDYVKSFNVGNPGPVGFYTASMSDFGLDLAMEDLWNENKERKLLELVALNDETKTKIDTINALLEHRDPRSRILTANDVADLKVALPICKNFLDQLVV